MGKLVLPNLQGKQMGQVIVTLTVTNRIDQVLGLEPDLKNRKLRVLPMNSEQTYLKCIVSDRFYLT